MIKNLKKNGIILFTALISCSFFIPLHYAEARKVTIPSDGLVKLVNPTAATVNYTIVCKDKAGVTTVPSTAETIAAGTSKTYGVTPATSACVPMHGAYNVTADAVGYLNNMVKCYKTAAMYVQVNQASQLCAASHRMCTLAEFYANKGSGTNLRGVVSATTYSSSITSGSTWTDRTQANNEYPYINDSYGSYYCATGANGAGSVVTGCESKIGTDNVEQAYCCPLTVVDQCEVNITSSTGHLQSPQFKGGAPF